MNRLICVGLVVLGTCLVTSAQFRGSSSSPSARIRVGSDNYECSCSYSCPSYGINAGTCYDSDSDYWRWGGVRPSYCCVIDYDTPDRRDWFDNRYDNRYDTYDRDYHYNGYNMGYNMYNNGYDADNSFF